MAYLVLARKYRPTTFDDIIGQEHVTRTLAGAFAQDRVHHAFLFCGPRGVGKTTAARVLARGLCCDKGPTPTPCGVCDACVSILSGTATDFLEIDGASNNSVDDVRELREGVRYQPAHLRRKIYVIDEVHMLSTSAFNALLKTLEEPPEHATFIFATTEVHKIPVTILSRCQRYDFKLVPHGQVVQHLEGIFQAEGIAAEVGALALLAREGGGSVRDTLSLADQCIAYAGQEALTEKRVAELLGVADRGVLASIARAMVKKQPAEALMAARGALDRGVDPAHLARNILAMLRDLAVVQKVQPTAQAAGLVEASADELAELAELAAQVSAEELYFAFHRFGQACEELAESPTPHMVLEIALLELASAPPLLPIAGLVARLEGLEARLGKPQQDRGTSSGGSNEGPSTESTRAPVERPSSRPRLETAPPPVPARERTETAASPAPSAQLPPHGDPLDRWEQTLNRIESESSSLAGIYAHARPLAFNGTSVTLGFVKGSFQAQLASDSDNVRKLETLLTKVLGSPMTVAVANVDAPAQGAAGPASVADLDDQRRRHDRDERDREAREHPLTRTVLEVFDTRIEKVDLDHE